MRWVAESNVSECVGVTECNVSECDGLLKVSECDGLLKVISASVMGY